jgi:molecular chaperone DnaJ
MATGQRDYYEILGVPRDADEKAIKGAYRQLALKYHPDRNKDPDAAEHFKEITQAFAVLSDPEKRTRYDTYGHAGMAGFSPEDLFGGIDFGDLFRGQGLDFGGGIFDSFFGRHRTDQLRGADIEVNLNVPLERVLQGGEETVHFTRPEKCSACEGSGAKPGTKPRTCDSCKGTGQHVTSRFDRGVNFQQVTYCHQCAGRGSVIDEPCPKCGGRGVVARAETLSVQIPRGVKDGMALRVRGHGRPCDKAGGTPGDLHVRVFSQRDARFERRGPHLWREEIIEVADAALGKKLEIPTLEGHATVTIPPGAQPGTVLRLKGEGLPAFGSDSRGDLYLAVGVHVPEKLTDQERALYEQLREARCGEEPTHESPVRLV